jgi:hypothetical protein
MGHRLISGNSLTPEDFEDTMDHFIDAFEDRDIRGMIRLCRICPRVFDEPFETDRYRGISASAIVLAVAIQNVDMVRALAGLLVEWGYNPTLVYDIDNGSPSSTLLIKAAEYGSFYIIRNLWDVIGMDVNAKDCLGYTALTRLFKHQPGLDVYQPGLDGLHHERLCILQILLRNGADASITDPTTGETPLFMACYQHTARPARLLLQNGANPFALDRFGRTPKEKAILYNNGGVADNVSVGILQEVEDRIITFLRVRNETRKLALMMGFHKRLGEASRVICLDPGMVHRGIADEWFGDYTRLELSNMSKEEVLTAIATEVDNPTSVSHVTPPK